MMREIEEQLQTIAAAKAAEVDARHHAWQVAAEYRRVVADAVASWRAQGLSMRQSAIRMGITEGALRQLLRPEGSPRKGLTETSAGTGTESGHEPGPGSATESPATS